MDLEPIEERANEFATWVGKFDSTQRIPAAFASAADVPALIAEVERLRAEVRLAKASAHSASLALGARLTARPAPAWDEDAVRAALVAAQLASVSKTMYDGYPSIFVRSNEDAADAALAVVRDDLDARVPARDLGDRNHARGLLAEAERLRAEVATERAEVTRLRTMVGDCHCDKNPETTNGPEEDCPQHGRPVAEVWDLVKGAAAGWDHARAEVDRLCAEARLANASAHSAGLALGARLDHPHGGFPEGTWIAEQFDAARPAPAWDEDAVVEGMARAVYPFLFADDRQPLRVFGETRSDAELREGERDVARERMRQALAVVRDHLQ